MAHVIREISIKDVENFIDLLSKIYDESDFTFYNPGEYSPSIASVSQSLESYITTPSKAIFVAESDEQLVGYAFVNTETFERTQHEAVVYLGVKSIIKNMVLVKRSSIQSKLGHLIIILDA